MAIRNPASIFSPEREAYADRRSDRTFRELVRAAGIEADAHS
jgi:hypothetical protein